MRKVFRKFFDHFELIKTTQFINFALLESFNDFLQHFYEEPLLRKKIATSLVIKTLFIIYVNVRKFLIKIYKDLDMFVE